MNGDESSDGQGVVPLRTILINFLNLVETYEARRNGGSDSYDSEFQELKQFSETLKSDPDYECKEGEKSVNRKKNRYKDILPFDYTRVILSDYGDVPGSDYINANFIKGASGSSAYIASQGPLPHTVNDFWRMVVECEVQVIVMACNEQESGKHKCENYWVEEDSKEREFGEVTVWLKKCRQVCPDFLVRTMRIRFTNSRGEKEERNVCQFHYSAWPDHGVPTKVRPLLDMVRLIRDRQTSETLPVLVHCSAGCGRTGTICAIDYVWGLLRLGRLTRDFSLFTLVREMRKQRIAMVQTKDQYILVHRAVKELFQEQLKIIDSHPYANVNQDGLPFDLKKELEEPTYEVLDFKKVFVNSGNNSLRSDNEYQDVSGNNNNNNHITVSVSNVNVNSVKASPPPLPPPSLGPSTTSPPVSSLSSSGETASSSTPPATVDKSETRTQLSDKARPSESRSSKKHSTKSSRPSPSPEKVLEKKNSSGSSDSEATNKSTSNNIRSALLRKPSMSKLKSLFERNPNKEERKPGQLSRAKSDVSTRFYNFTSFGKGTPSEAKGTTEEGGKGINGKKTESSSSATSNPKKPPILTKPTIPIKRSKSFKIHQQPDSSSTTIAPITNHVEKSRKKSDNSVSTNVSTSSTTPSSSSHTFSTSSSTSSPIKVCVKQVEIPKLQAVVSKSIKPEAQTAVTTAQEYDYDIDDRSHLRQKPISQSALQREALQKSSKSNNSLNSSTVAAAESSNDVVDNGTKKSSEPPKVAKIPSSSSAFVKPEPPSRAHILKDTRYNNDYANVGFTSSKVRHRSKHNEMEDLLSRSEDRKKFEKLKKCDTVNPRILAASMGIAAPKQERPSLTRSHSHVWQADKTQIPIRIFSDENLHQSSTSTTNFPDKRGLNEANKFPSGGKPAENGEIFIQAIHPEVKSVSSSEYRRNEQEASLSSSTTHSAVVNSKPIQRRRVPKTNPYANYPACITGSNTNFPYKLPHPTDDSDSYPVNHNDSHHRTGISSIPNLRPSHAGGGNSVGNSSDSSSNTGTPRNSSPGTPTQIVDSVYPKLFRNGRSNPATHDSNDGSIPRTNGIINSNGSQPKSILKESLASTPSESEEILDTPRQFPSVSSSNLPKINTIRIAVGVRERRNSFRQAVWKEAQPASPPGNPIITEQLQQNMPPASNDTLHQLAEHSRIINSNPFSSSYKTTNEVPKVHKNYEPIWPDPNSSSNIISNGGSNPFYTPSFSSERIGEGGPSTSNPFTNFSASHLQSNSKFFTDPSSSARPNEPTGFQTKVDEIKVMLAELNAPVTTGEKSFSKEHGESSGSSSIPVLKQHRSLRAPSRSHYQQGLSCFAFRKPSSYESIVDQLQHEENPPVKNFSEVTAQPEHSSRTANDYVTLGQCRTVDKVSMTNGFSTSESSPEFAKKFSSQYRHHYQPKEDSPSATPIPPPRTRRNHDNHLNTNNAFAMDYSNGNSRSSLWAKSNANYNHLPPPDNTASAVASSSVNHNSKYSELRDEFSHSSSTTEVNQNEKTLNSTSPKAIIRALGLFQAKAANIRSRLPNWGENKDRSVTKRPLENETSSGTCLDSTKPEENSSVQNRFHEPLCTPLLKPMTSQLTSSGLVQRSKHQYL